MPNFKTKKVELKIFKRLFCILDSHKEQCKKQLSKTEREKKTIEMHQSVKQPGHNVQR